MPLSKSPSRMDSFMAMLPRSECACGATRADRASNAAATSPCRRSRNWAHASVAAVSDSSSFSRLNWKHLGAVSSGGRGVGQAGRDSCSLS